MKYTTAAPLSIWEYASIVDRKGLLTVEGEKARIMNYTEGQEIEAEKTAVVNGVKFALKPANKPEYKYIAFTVKED